MKAYAFRRGGSSFVSSLDDLPAKLGARTNRARSLHQSVLLEMLELAKGAGDVVRNKPLDCVGIRAPGHRAGRAGLGTLLLRCSRNILILRSESGRTIGWAQAHFFVAAGGDEHSTGLGRGVFK
jgi:hypothetical protein